MKIDLILGIAFLCLISAHAGPVKDGFLVFTIILFVISVVYHIRNLKLNGKFY
jgi:hypothetical protein